MELNNQGNGKGVESAINQTTPINKTEQPKQDQQSMETLLGEEGLGLDFPQQGEIRTGVVASLGENEILVSIGAKSEGIISGRELESIPPDERAKLEVGSEIPVYVLQQEDADGNVVLSYLRAREQRDWELANELLETARPVETNIVGFNKGGLLVPVGRLRGFVPASQISLLRRSASEGETPEQRWNKMIGEPVTVRVIEVDRERRRLILSERLALQETRETLKDRLLDELKEGDVRTGRVTSIAEFGVFVNIDGADGLVHLSEISWDRIQHPNEVLKIGQEVKVKVISIDHEKKRIGLSIRQLLEDPWLKKVEHMREGQLVEGTITHLTKFGAFARLSENLEGLIHLSEISDQRITHPKEAIKEGEQVTVRIIKIDPERRRIALSLRKVDSPAYADLDWKMALANEVEGVKLVEGQESEAEAESSPEAGEAVPPLEAQEPSDDTPSVKSEDPVDVPVEASDQA
jgi:small subunit ribosomal protein S1